MLYTVPKSKTKHDQTSFATLQPRSHVFPNQIGEPDLAIALIAQQPPRSPTVHRGTCPYKKRTRRSSHHETKRNEPWHKDRAHDEGVWEYHKSGIYCAMNINEHCSKSSQRQTKKRNKKMMKHIEKHEKTMKGLNKLKPETPASCSGEGKSLDG